MDKHHEKKKENVRNWFGVKKWNWLVVFQKSGNMHTVGQWNDAVTGLDDGWEGGLVVVGERGRWGSK